MKSPKIETYKNFPTLRAPGQEIPLTPEQTEEYIKCSVDPMYFLTHYYTITSLDRGEIIFDPYNYQRDFLNTIVENRFIAILAARQLGKSVLVGGYYLWDILFNPNHLLGYYSRTADDAKKILARIKLAYERVPLWLQKGVVEWQKGSIQLENKSKIEAGATTANSGRGGSYNVVCITGDAKITLKDKETGKIFDTTISDLYYDCLHNYCYIYKITNTENGHYYYGQHTTDNLDDGYMGSGLYIKRSKEKYKERFLQVFTKEIVEFCTIEEKDAREEYYIKTHYDDPNCMNINCEANQYVARKHRIKLPYSKEWHLKMSEIAKQRTGAKNGMFGRGYLLKGENNGMYGRKQKKSSRKLMSQKRREYISKNGSEKFSGKGCIYIHNSLGEVKRWEKTVEIPAGWMKGTGKQNSLNPNYHNKKFIYNPKRMIEKVIKPWDDIPEGWFPGRLLTYKKRLKDAKKH